MTKVYVSATFRDLEECRSAVMLALRRLRVEDVAMESYVAEDRRPVERCLADVAECDLYVGIFAWRYGFIPAGYDRSITELEYRHAEELRQAAADLPARRGGAVAAHPHRPGHRRRASSRRCGPSWPTGTCAARSPGRATWPRWSPRRSPTAWWRWAGPAGALHSLSPDMLKRYFDRLHQQYGGLDLDALTPPQREEYLQMRLSSVYIEQSVREEPPPVELPREWWQRMQAEGHLETADVPEEVDAEELALIHQAYRRQAAAPPVRRGRRAGQPRDRAARRPGLGQVDGRPLHRADPRHTGAPVDDRLAGLAEHLPLFVELRSYAALAAEGRCDTFVDYLDHRADHRRPGPGEAGAARLPGRRRPGRHHLRRPRRDLRQAPARVGGQPDRRCSRPSTRTARVLVTSRVIGYARRILTEQGFAHFTLQDLDEIQITEFLTSWYRLAMHDRPDDARARRARLMEAMRHSQSIHELAGNPMLLDDPRDHRQAPGAAPRAVEALRPRRLGPGRALGRQPPPAAAVREPGLHRRRGQEGAAAPAGVPDAVRRARACPPTTSAPRSSARSSSRT